MRLARITLAAAALACATACGSRSGYWNQQVDPSSTTFGLANGVAVVDDAAHRVVVLEAQPDGSVAEQDVTIGHDVVTAQASPDGKYLFVLTNGATATDEPPQLTRVDASSFTVASKTYPMTHPMPSLAVDPLGAYAVAYTGAGAPTSFVSNPNEIVIFDLSDDPSATNPVDRSIQSFGGTPQQLTFTPVMNLPASLGGQTRLLLLQSDIDLTLLDLDHAFDPPAAPGDQPGRPEITIQLTDGTTTTPVTPAGVVVDADDAQIALWASNDPDVYVFQFGPSMTGAANPFAPTINIASVAGIPSQVAFVHTSNATADDDGLRVLALVPSESEAQLIDDSSNTTTVALPAPYTNLSLVTDVAGTGGSTDVALLWAQSGAKSGDDLPAEGAGVAFWDLGETTGGIDGVDVPDAIQAVLDVPGADPETEQLKILEVAGTEGIVVLDLVARTASPLDTSTSPSLSFSLDGERMWAYSPGGTDLAQIDLASLAITPLTVDAPIGAVYDVARSDGAPALVALDTQGTWGATVFDATKPSAATARETTALLLEATP